MSDQVNPVFQLAWELYCEQTKGDMDVKDHWEDVPASGQVYFLEKAAAYMFNDKYDAPFKIVSTAHCNQLSKGYGGSGREPRTSAPNEPLSPFSSEFDALCKFLCLPDNTISFTLQASVSSIPVVTCESHPTTMNVGVKDQYELQRKT